MSATISLAAGLGDAQDEQHPIAESSETELGFNPLKRHPFVILHRMDSAGNRDGILEPAEVPVIAQSFVERLMIESKVPDALVGP